MSIFGLAMGEATEHEFGRQIERIASEREAAERDGATAASGPAAASAAEEAPGRDPLAGAPQPGE